MPKSGVEKVIRALLHPVRQQQAEGFVAVPAQPFNVVEEAPQEEVAGGNEEAAAQQEGEKVVAARLVRVGGQAVLDKSVQVAGD